MLNPKLIGAFLGMVVGLVAVLVGIWQAFILVLFILAGWLIGRIYMGELNPFAMYRKYKASREEKKREEF
jgi:hypothetical protein